MEWWFEMEYIIKVKKCELGTSQGMIDEEGTHFPATQGYIMSIKIPLGEMCRVEFLQLWRVGSIGDNVNFGDIYREMKKAAMAHTPVHNNWIMKNNSYGHEVMRFHPKNNPTHAHFKWVGFQYKESV